MRLSAVLCVLAFFGVSYGEQECPCAWCGNGEANCANQLFTQVPGPFPNYVTGIHMQYNKIKEIKTNDFKGSTKVSSIRLDQNDIKSIQRGAFSRFPFLNDIELSWNKIKSLPNNLFHPDAPLLGGIKAANNKITKFPLGLLKKTRSSIIIVGNPIHCDCNTVIPADLKTKVYGQCYTPRHLRGRDITSITSQDVESECNEPTIIKTTTTTTATTTTKTTTTTIPTTKQTTHSVHTTKMTMKDCKSVFKMLENNLVPNFPLPGIEYQNAFDQVRSFIFNLESDDLTTKKMTVKCLINLIPIIIKKSKNLQ